MLRDLCTVIGAVVMFAWIALVAVFSTLEVMARTKVRYAELQRERRRRRIRRATHPIGLRFGATNDRIAVAALLAMLDGPRGAKR